MSDIASFVRARLGEREHFGTVSNMAAKRRADYLREVAAMRAIVDLYERLDYESDKSDGLADLAARVAAAAAARDAVRHLAAIWHEHEQYDPAWSPDA